MEIIYKLPELFASALIGVLFTVLIPYVIKEMLMYKSAYSGYWVNVRDDKKNNIVKEDVFRMKHNPKTGFIKGKIVNIVTEKGKTQFVIGILKQDEIVYVVYSYDPIPSYSAVYVRLEESYVFSGFYLSQRMNKEMRVKEIDSIAITMRKISRQEALEKLAGVRQLRNTK